MFGQLLIRATRLSRNVRFFRSNPALRDAKKETDSVSSVSKTAPRVDLESVVGPRMQRCSDFEKWMLVWLKKYPSKDQIPEKVPMDVVEKIRNKVRIRIANLMMFVTILGCIWAVWSGKSDRKLGKTVGQANVDWHTEINREYKASVAAAPKSN